MTSESIPLDGACAPAVLDRAECLALLATQPVGRLAFTRRALPDVIPVNFLMSGSDVLIRLDPRSSVARAVRDSVVAFEVDDVDPGTRTGWSVTVVGQATAHHSVAGVAEVAGVAGPVPWAPGERDLLIRISTERITGRRLG
jgi:uncharacterized protein